MEQSKLIQSKLKPWHGLVALVFVLVLNIFVFSSVQAALGVWGLVLTELFIAAVAVIGVFAFGGNRNDLFPVAKTKPKYVAGSVVMWVGMFILVLAVGSATQILFPEMAEATSYVGEIFGTSGILLSIIIPAVMAGVCEELLHRGLILSSFKAMQSTWLRILIMGALFGVFHLDPYRFLSTAILGGFFAFIVLRTGNIILAMVLHTLNDLVGFLMLYISRDAVNDAATQASVGWTTVIIMLVIAAIPFAIGCVLMRKDKNRTAVE